jgi:hypothetical protein
MPGGAPSNLAKVIGGGVGGLLLLSMLGGTAWLQFGRRLKLEPTASLPTDHARDLARFG